MNELEIREQETLVLPATGEVLDLADTPAVVAALVGLRDLEQKIRDAKRVLTTAIVAESKRQGSKTIELSDGSKAEIRGGERVLYDAQALEAGLRALGMPDDRLAEIVKTEIVYSVDGREAKRAAGANEYYRRVVEGAATIIEETSTISVRRPA